MNDPRVAIVQMSQEVFPAPLDGRYRAPAKRRSQASLDGLAQPGARYLNRKEPSADKLRRQASPNSLDLG